MYRILLYFRNVSICCDSYRTQKILRGNKEAGVFNYYRKHSKQLVMRCNNGDKDPFTSCEYEDDKLCVNCSEQVEPSDISYMEEMKNPNPIIYLFPILICVFHLYYKFRNLCSIVRSMYLKNPKL
jgi:hypothetical protein